MAMGLISRLRGGEKVVLHYTGHRILGDPARSRFPVRRERDVARAIARTLKREKVVAGYGSLASGSDILFAEALLAAGAELHITLACDDVRFVELSVAEAGDDWVARFYRALDRATTVSRENTAKSAVDFGAASERALDLAEQAASRTGRGRLQVAVFDGRRGRGDAGTGPDIDRAKARGWRQIILRLRRRGRVRPML